MDIYKLAHQFYISAVKHSGGCLFYCAEDKTVLLVRRSKQMNSPNTWSLPGGRPEDYDEDSKATAIREATEELKVLPKNKKEIGRHDIAHKEHRYDVYIFEISKKEKEDWTKKIRLDEENSEFEWFSINKLPKDTHFDLAWIPSKIK